MRPSIPLHPIVLAVSASLAAPAFAEATYTVPYIIEGERYAATLTRDEDGTLTIDDYGNDNLTASQQASIDDHVESHNERTVARDDALEDGRPREDEVETARSEADAGSDEVRAAVETSRASVESARETGDTETVRAAVSDARDSIRSAIENR